MRTSARAVTQWIDRRTGLISSARTFLNEEIPASSGWPQVFGSVALFLFLVQAFTGILLALNYAPTPGEAYSSLRFIINEVSGGRMIRGLHHWGASMMIVVVVLHMLQVFLYGAYRKPREATWLAGIALLLLVLGFGLTGYLLPWDNRAYWGTVVTTQIMGQAPFIGKYVQRFTGAENGVGAVTFARFYSLHVLILPAATTLLIALHVYLVRRHGVTPGPSDNRTTRKTFYPQQALKDVVAIFVAFSVLFLMAATVQAPLERLADPSDAEYIPRPEWYFLFLFQTLKFFEGALEPIGSVVLPTLTVLLLALVPFLDRGQIRRVWDRKIAMGAVALGIVGWTALTAAAVLTTPKQASQSLAGISSQEWNYVSPDELAGVGYFKRQQCGKCHNLVEGAPKAGPNLGLAASTKPEAWKMTHFKNNGGMSAGHASELNSVELRVLSTFLQRGAPEEMVSLLDVPEEMITAAQIYVRQGCSNCHKVNDAGQDAGPVLNGLMSRRSREWVEKHFADPQAMSPGTSMPPYHFSSADQKLLVDYLFSLPVR